MFLFFTSPVQCVAGEVTLMEFALKSTSNHHVRPARLALTPADLIHTDIRGNATDAATGFACGLYSCCFTNLKLVKVSQFLTVLK